MTSDIHISGITHRRVFNMDYKTHGVCSSMIHVELDGDKIKDVDFVGGCNGNLQGISSLVKGMKVEEALNCLQFFRPSKALRTNVRAMKYVDCCGRASNCFNIQLLLNF